MFHSVHILHRKMVRLLVSKQDKLSWNASPFPMLPCVLLIKYFATSWLCNEADFFFLNWCTEEKKASHKKGSTKNKANNPKHHSASCVNSKFYFSFFFGQYPWKFPFAFTCTFSLLSPYVFGSKLPIRNALFSGCCTFV